jgi:hypothetical protein
MRQDNYPHPVADPEAEGLPGTADDDSYAYDDVDSSRSADGLDPAALPSDRPLGMDRFGVTAAEERLGESLDRKLDRETPEVTLADGEPRRDAARPVIAAEAFDAEPADAFNDVLDTDTTLDDTPVEANLDSPVSMYDTGIDGTGRVGRLVDPDSGGAEDTEKDAVAWDAGAAGGGASAEELAMHEEPER